MKKSDIVQIIKEELLKEVDQSNYTRMNSLLITGVQDKLGNLIASIDDSLTSDGYEREEVLDFINTLVEDALGPDAYGGSPRKTIKHETVIKEYDAAAIASGFKNTVAVATTRDYKEVKVGDKVKYFGNPLVISKIYSQTGKTMIFAESPDKVAFVTDIASRFSAG